MHSLLSLASEVCSGCHQAEIKVWPASHGEPTPRLSWLRAALLAPGLKAASPRPQPPRSHHLPWPILSQGAVTAFKGLSGWPPLRDPSRTHTCQAAFPREDALTVSEDEPRTPLGPPPPPPAPRGSPRPPEPSVAWASYSWWPASSSLQQKGESRPSGCTRSRWKTTQKNVLATSRPGQ